MTIADVTVAAQFCTTSPEEKRFRQRVRESILQQDGGWTRAALRKFERFLRWRTGVDG